MRIGELAAKAGVSVRALRYYEEQGLLTSTRSASGQRTYVPSDVHRVELLQSLYAVNLSSRAIAEILPCVDDPSSDHSEQAWTRIRRHRDQIAANIDEMIQMRDALDQALDRHCEHQMMMEGTGRGARR